MKISPPKLNCCAKRGECEASLAKKGEEREEGENLTERGK